MIADLQALHDQSDYASANVRCYGHIPPKIRKRPQKLRAGYDKLWADLIQADAAGRLEPGLDPVALRYALIGMLNWTLEWRGPGGPSPKAPGTSFFAIAFDGAGP